MAGRTVHEGRNVGRGGVHQLFRIGYASESAYARAADLWTSGRKVLNPGRQFWPCPLLYVTACETCSFLEYDRGGRPQCVALVKLRTVLDGTNAGEDLSEIRNLIRNS